MPELNINKVSIKQSNDDYITKNIGAKAENIKINNNITLLDKAKEWDKKIDLDENKTLSTNSFTTVEKNKLKKIEKNAQKNIIKKIKINGILQNIENKNINIEIPSIENYTKMNHDSLTTKYGIASEENYGHAKFGKEEDSIVEAIDERLFDKRDPISHSDVTDYYGIGSYGSNAEMYGHFKLIDSDIIPSAQEGQVSSAKFTKDFINSFGDHFEYDENNGKLILYNSLNNIVNEVNLSDGTDTINNIVCLYTDIKELYEHPTATISGYYYSTGMTHDNSSSSQYLRFEKYWHTNNGEVYLPFYIKDQNASSYRYISTGNRSPISDYSSYDNFSLSDLSSTEYHMVEYKKTTYYFWLKLRVYTKYRDLYFSEVIIKGNSYSPDSDDYDESQDVILDKFNLKNGYGEYVFFNFPTNMENRSRCNYIWLEYQTFKSRIIPSPQPNYGDAPMRTEDVCLNKNSIPLVPWSTGTDAQITAMINGYYNGDLTLGDIQTVWNLGDCRTVHFSEMGGTYVDFIKTPAQDVELQIIDFHHDDLVKKVHDKTKALITVDLKGVLKKSDGNYQPQVMSTFYWGVDWKDSQMRQWCNITFFQGIPLSLRKLIKPVKKISIKKSWKDGDSRPDIVTEDKCFLLSYNEYEKRTDMWNREGFTYAWYSQKADNRCKQPVEAEGDKTAKFGLRTADNWNFTYNAQNTGLNLTPSYSWMAVAPAFCL